LVIAFEQKAFAQEARQSRRSDLGHYLPESEPREDGDEGTLTLDQPGMSRIMDDDENGVKPSSAARPASA